jgi:hypothetical protein
MTGNAMRTCGELVDEREGSIVRVGHGDDCTGDRNKEKKLSRDG